MDVVQQIKWQFSGRGSEHQHVDGCDPIPRLSLVFFFFKLSFIKSAHRDFTDERIIHRVHKQTSRISD